MGSTLPVLPDPDPGARGDQADALRLNEKGRWGAIRVAFFIGCINDAFFPEAGMAAVHILERLGVQVDFPAGQTCCGQAHWNSGYRAQARRLAQHFVEVFDGADYIVSPSGSCTAMVREYYPILFTEAAAAGPAAPAMARRAAAVAGRAYEFTEFIVNVLGRTDLGATYPARAVYHASCHTTRLLHVTEPPLQLLQAVDGLELLPLPGADRCCGFGGTFAVKSPEISLAMADDKLDDVRATGADLVVSADTSCLLHLMGRARRRRLGLRFVHIAELLAEGMGLWQPQAPFASVPAKPLETPA